MKRSALIKDIFRDIKKSLGRFLSIVGIVALGVAFFSGLKIAPEDMRYTADKYYDDYRLMDLRIVSNLGLSQDDLKAIDSVEGVETSFGTYSLDALTEVKDREIVVKVHGYESEKQINAPRLIEGRYPQAEDECLIEYNKEGYLDIEIGSQLDLKSGKEEDLETDLLNTSYKVVGKVTSPYYLSFEKGSTNIGNGEVRDFIMIPQSNFKSQIFTDIFATIRGAKELNSYESKYFDHIKESKEELKELAKNREIVRYEEVLKEIREEIDEGKDKYYSEKEKAEKELSKALDKLEEGKEELDRGNAQLIKNEREFYQTINKAKQEIKNAEKDIEDGKSRLSREVKKFEEMKNMALKDIEKAEKDLEEGKEAISRIETEIQTMEDALKNPMLPEEDRIRIEEEYASLKVLLLQLKEKLELGEEEVEKNKNLLLLGEKELEEEKVLVTQSEEKLTEEKKKVESLEKDTLSQFKIARLDLEKAKSELDKGEEEYNKAEREAQEELTKAWKKISDGEEKIKDIEKAKWYVLDRDSHYSYLDYGGAADRIDSLAKVFPLFFALVAALVSLTTMTRMVDEQRVNIGTLKALGYSRREIVAKYIVYALLASLLGCIIGISIGYTLFPTVIFNAYGMMYQLPPVILRFNGMLVFYISIVTIGLITSTSYLATSSELKENSASLMRPKSPRLGKKILIEKIDFIWKRFNFSNKVTIRNIFRYKRRFFMTVFGIAGSTALILTGFGVRDSIRTIVDRQYGSLFNYDMTIGIEEEFKDDLWENKKILDYSFIHREGASVENKSKEMDISLVVPENRDDIANFIKLYDRKKDERIRIPKEGAIISEQISKLLNVKIGEEILLKNSDDELAKVKISGITENYTFNYVYLSSDYYDSIFESSLRYEEVLANTGDLSKEDENILSKEIVMKDNINSVSFTSSLRDNFQDTINSLNYVVLIMIVSAGALAFVVLYNLTNINISERIREIATIKVLGFYDGEVSKYIYRENIILTIIGTMAGLVMGIFLHRYIMLTVEMENIMFGLRLDIRSYIYAVLITFLFSIIVNFAMHFRLKNVEMVESLKSVD